MPPTPSAASPGSHEVPTLGNDERAGKTSHEHDFLDLSPPDRFCDLVLTGGVTSAIAYPGLIFGLAQSYRFHGVGGSSSGAGTAALAAAAEYRRRRGSPEGFRAMLRGSLAMREEAATPQASGEAQGSPAANVRKSSRPARGTRLSWLFQPDPDLARLFDSIAPGLAAGRPVRVITGLLRGYLGPILLFTALAQTLLCEVLWACNALQWFPAFLALLVAIVVGLAATLTGPVWSDFRRFASRDFGLCTGQKSLPGAPHAPLTAWLHGLIQQVAGRSADDAPLTFADLHGVRGGPDDLLGRTRTPASRSIDLRIYTANVTHGRPIVFPQPEAMAGGASAASPGGASAGAPAATADDDTLYFKPAEMRRLFPDRVVDHMLAHSVPAAGQPGHEAEVNLWQLPRLQLPVIVAARISVAFPVLFRAVPLWSWRAGLAETGDPGSFERCLFADGSLCSNFPIHLFDSLLPAWPTFGLALIDRPDIAHYRDPGAAAASMVELHEATLIGGEDRVNPRMARARATIERLMQYLSAMLSTTLHWHDTSLARLPGVRERVVQVGLPAGIGGLNIYMNRDQIDYLASLGAEAAKALLKRYSVPDQPGGVARGWSEHRWVRLHLLCDSLREALAGVGASAEFARHALPLSRQIDEATRQTALQTQDDQRLLPGDAAALQAALAALAQLESALGHAPADPTFDLHPRPVLRVQPPA